ncbi:MAG: hypothetical protein V1698_00605 [bacterium]
MLNCKKCNKQILGSKDVNFVALFGIIPVAMCNDCYASLSRKIARIFYTPPRWTINSIPFSIMLFLMTAIFAIIIPTVLLGEGLATVNGASANLTFGARIIIVVAVLAILTWQWGLWIWTRSSAKKLR